MKSTESKAEKCFFIAIIGILLGLLLVILAAEARAEIKIIYQHTCTDSDQACLNDTQAATQAETAKQVRKAARIAQVRTATIYSVDPWRPSAAVWEYGAKRRGGKILFAAMPGCPNARKELERLLRRIK